MPTGYTAFLKEGMPAEEWLRRILPRSMCACIMLRDEPLDLTVEQIEAHLVRDAGDGYYTENVREAETELAVLRARSANDWHADLERRRVENAAGDAKSRAEAHQCAVAYADASRALKHLAEQTLSGEYDRVVSYGLEQLHDADGDTLPYSRSALPATWQEYAQASIKAAEVGLKAARTLADEQGQNARARLEWFRGWQQFLSGHLPKPEANAHA